MKSKSLVMLLTATMIAACTWGCTKTNDKEKQTEANQNGTGQSAEAGQTEAGKTDESHAEASENNFIGNPWVYTDDKAEAESLSKLSFQTPEGYEEITYGVLTTTNMLEMSFKDFAGTSYTARAQATMSSEDISGYESTTIEWDFAETSTVAGFDGMLKQYRDEEAGTVTELLIWYDKTTGVSYSLDAVGEDLDGLDLEAVAEYILPQ